jgi:hypothetical protein
MDKIEIKVEGIANFPLKILGWGRIEIKVEGITKKKKKKPFRRVVVGSGGDRSPKVCREREIAGERRSFVVGGHRFKFLKP